VFGARAEVSHGLTVGGAQGGRMMVSRRARRKEKEAAGRGTNRSVLLGPGEGEGEFYGCRRLEGTQKDEWDC
jgi:hypothetical protein